jgi:hypothetical protein
MVGKRKNRRKTSKRFKNIPQLLRLLINVNRNSTPQRKVMEICHVFVNSRCAILPPLLLAGEEFSGVAQRLSYTLYELPKGFRIVFGYFLYTFGLT